MNAGGFHFHAARTLGTQVQSFDVENVSNPEIFRGGVVGDNGAGRFFRP